MVGGIIGVGSSQMRSIDIIGIEHTDSAIVVLFLP